jgi:hypothetical protein
MASITPERIAEIIADAPGWALVALTVPQERLRQDARRELGHYVYSALYQPIEVETAQLSLQL